MSRQRSKWMTAGLLAATLGLWGAAFIAPEFHLDRNDVADCRGLGIMAGVALIVWLMTGPRIRRLEQRQDDQDAAWSIHHQGAAAASGERPAGLRLTGGRSA